MLLFLRRRCRSEGGLPAKARHRLRKRAVTAGEREQHIGAIAGFAPNEPDTWRIELLLDGAFDIAVLGMEQPPERPQSRFGGRVEADHGGAVMRGDFLMRPSQSAVQSDRLVSSAIEAKARLPQESTKELSGPWREDYQLVRSSLCGSRLTVLSQDWLSLGMNAD